MCMEMLPLRLLERLGQLSAASVAEHCQTLNEAVLATNQLIYSRASADARLTGMGTTLTAALLEESYLCVAQVGDSRAYLVRAGRAEQLTRDQTVWESLRDLAQASAPDEASWKNMLTQAVGAGPEINVAITELALKANDWLLLCTDGLHRVLRVEEIAAIFQDGTGPGEKALELTSRANQHGGPDNVTVIVCQVVNSPSGTSELIDP